MWQDTVSNFKGFTEPMGTVSDLQCTFPLIQVPLDTRIIVFSGDIYVSLITTIAKIVILQETAYIRVSLLYVSNNHISFSLLIL